MSAGPVVKKMSIPEYLAFEAASKERHEYLRGEVYAMAGGTPEHGAIAAAVIVALGNALQGRPCRVFNSDVRVRVEETDLFTCPDVFVVCGKLERSARDPDSVTNPVVVVEVLSPSTESYDRGAKAQHYLQIPALREYVLINHVLPRIEHGARPRSLSRRSPLRRSPLHRGPPRPDALEGWDEIAPVKRLLDQS